VGVIELHRKGEIAYREALPDGDEAGAPVVCLHGFPESSRMWEPVLEALAASGRRAMAPDLYGLGDSADKGPATFERNRDAVIDFIADLELERVTLVVHDWGGFVGLAWACEHPDQVAALVISDTGFFADGKWHGMAQAMRSEQGEGLIGALDREGFAALLNAGGEVFSESELDAYWAPFESGRGQRSALEFYRSMDFEKLAPYEGRLGELDVPALLLWGADDQFAPVAGARRFERELQSPKLVIIEGAGHFVYDEQRQRCAREIVGFLDERGV
jgi:haloalkane dehalogenase